jgi:hypothetical protein
MYYWKSTGFEVKTMGNEDNETGEKKGKKELSPEMKEGLAKLKKTLDDPHELLDVFNRTLSDPDVKDNFIIKQINCLTNMVYSQGKDIQGIKRTLRSMAKEKKGSGKKG